MGTIYTFCSFCGRVETNEPGVNNYPGDGIMCIMTTGQVSNLNTFSPPESEEDIADIKRVFMSEMDKSTTDKENSYLTLWNEEKGELEVLYGTIDEPINKPFLGSPKNAAVLDSSLEDEEALPF